MVSLNSSSSSPSPFSSLQILPSSSSSSLRALLKFKAVLQTLILSLARAISRAKTTAFHILKQANHHSPIANLKRNKKKLLYGSFRLHYNWGSVSSKINHSHVTPAVLTWDHGGCGGDQLGGYLQWLEERDNNNYNTKNEEEEEDEDEEVNEIDKLAEIFIAKCHEKFKLEKQESYRRFQDMMATSF